MRDPSPTLAPGALAQIGLLLLLASIGHPALQREERPDADTLAPSPPTTLPTA